MPFQDGSHAIYLAIIKNKLNIPMSLHSDARSFLQALLTADISKRLVNPEDMKAHPWFRGVDWSLVAQRRALPPWVPTLVGPGDVQNFDLYSVSEDGKAKARWQAMKRHATGAERSFADF